MSHAQVILDEQRLLSEVGVCILGYSPLPGLAESLFIGRVLRVGVEWVQFGGG